MLARTGFPEYLESIAIGPDPDFLINQTDLCDIALEFPQEVNAVYLFKKIATSVDPLTELREFTKHFLVDGPDFSEEFILHFVKKVNMLPPDIKDQIMYEIEDAFEKADAIRGRVTPTNTTATQTAANIATTQTTTQTTASTTANIATTQTTANIASNTANIAATQTTASTTANIAATQTTASTTANIAATRTTAMSYDPVRDTPEKISKIIAADIKQRKFNKSRGVNNDANFLDKLSNMMDSCKSSSNYFAPITDKIGSIFDFSRMNSLNASMPHDGDLNAPPPIGLGLNIMNKIPRGIQDTLMEAYTSAKLLVDAAKETLTSPGTTQKLREFAKQGISAERKGVPFIGSTSSSLFQDALGLNSSLMTKVKRNLGDSFRIADFQNRYNAFDEDMNLAVAKKKVFKMQIPDASMGGAKRTWSGSAQGVSSGDDKGSEPWNNNITPQVALKPQTTGNARNYDDAPKATPKCPEDTPVGQSSANQSQTTPADTPAASAGAPATGSPVAANDPNAPWLAATGPLTGTTLPRTLTKKNSPMTMYGAFDDERTPDLNSIAGLGNTGVLEPGDVGLGSRKKAQIEAAIGHKLRPGDQFYLNGTKFRYADSGDEKNYPEVADRIDLFTPPGSRASTEKFMKEYNNRNEPDVVSYAGYKPIDRGKDLQAWTSRRDVKEAWMRETAAQGKIGTTRTGARTVTLKPGASYQGILQKLPGYETTRLARK